MSDIKMPHNTLPHLPLVLKIFAVIVGAMFALTMTGDIDREGRLHLSFGVFVKLTFSALFGFLGGDAIINYMNWEHWSITSHGFVMMCTSVFGMLSVGVVYQTVRLTAKDKTASELVEELKAVLKAIIR